MDPGSGERKYLICNADDFGRSAGINHGIICCHENGIVTSASLMVRWPAVKEAVAYCRQEGRELSLGLHVDLGEWCFDGTAWSAVYETVPIMDPSAVRGELMRQLETFRRLTGADPTHLDSHQHVHLRDPVRSALTAAARDLQVPLRGCAGIRYCGEFYGQSADGATLPEAIEVSGLLATLGRVPPGVTELACHPAALVDFEAAYAQERLIERDTLRDPDVRSKLAELEITLISFRGVGAVSDELRA